MYSVTLYPNVDVVSAARTVPPSFSTNQDVERILQSTQRLTTNGRDLKENVQLRPRLYRIDTKLFLDKRLYWASAIFPEAKGRVGRKSWVSKS